MHAYNDQTTRKDKATNWLLLLLQLLLQPRGVDASTVADGDADSSSDIGSAGVSDATRKYVQL